MSKAFRARITAIILFVVGLVLLASGFYVSWSCSIVLGTIAALSAVVSSLIIYSLLRRKIRDTKAVIEGKLIAWGLISTYITLVMCGAVFAATYVYNVSPQTKLVLSILILISTGVLLNTFAIVSQYHFLIIMFELLYIAFLSHISSYTSVDLWLYELLDASMIAAITILLMEIAMKHCGKRITFNQLLHLIKEFVVDSLSNAFSWLLFTMPFILILASIFVILNRALLSNFGALIKIGLVLVGAICVAMIVTGKLYRERCMSKLAATATAIAASVSLIYPLGVYSGWTEFRIEDPRDLESVLASSFILVVLFVHTPMICLTTNRDKCRELNKTD